MIRNVPFQRASNFKRKIFSLPAPSSLRNWLLSVNAEPGFFKEVFEAMKMFPNLDKDCTLMVDGMSIRKQLIWDTKSKSYLGFCDYGNDINLEPKKTEAKEALVMMVVGLRRRWKWPIGEFLKFIRINMNLNFVSSKCHMANITVH